MFATLLTSLLLTTSAEAGDKGDCRKARKQMTVESWTAYVLEHPEGACADEAIGQLMVLSVGRFAVNMVDGDRTKLALGLASLGRADQDDLSTLASLFGGGGLGGLGGFGGGGGMDLWGSGSGYGSGAGVLGALNDDYGYGYDDQQIYVSYYVDQVDGTWNEDQFWGALDGTRPALQDCYRGLGRSPMGIYYVVGFDVKEGATAVTSMAMDYSDDNAPHPDIEACVRDSVGTATFGSDVTGSYRYRVELY